MNKLIAFICCSFFLINTAQTTSIVKAGAGAADKEKTVTVVSSACQLRWKKLELTTFFILG